jgi:putative ABC transport system permease protein
VTPAPSRLPRWAAWLLLFVPLGDRRFDVETDFSELFAVRRRDRGRGYAARRLLGDIVSVCRPRTGRGQVVQDLRFGLRLFRKHPAAVGITTAGLALAIGAVTSVFSLINALVLRPYKMDDPSSVVRVAWVVGHGFIAEWPYADFLNFQREARLMDVVASSHELARFGLTADGQGTESLRVFFVSGNYLWSLGGRAAIGRTLADADDFAGAAPAAVVSHHFWRTRLNGDPSMVGRTIFLNGTPVTLVGVVQPTFAGPVDEPPSLWLSLASFDEVYHLGEFTPASRAYVNVDGRLRPGASLAGAETELQAITRGATGSRQPPNATRLPRLQPAASPASRADPEMNFTVILSLTTIGLVLALACANASNLILAGALTRVREIGIRLALGATRRRLVKQLLSESVLLGVIAGGLGLLLAVWLVPLLAWAMGTPPDVDVAPDRRVLVFTIAVAMTCGLAAGIAPARYGARGDLLGALKAQHDRSPRRSTRLRTSFVGFQAAVSIVLLVPAALLTRSALGVGSAGLRFDADRLLAVSAEVPRRNFDEPAYFDAALEAVRRIPGVERVSLTQTQPFGPSVERDRLTISGRSYELYHTRCDESYFATMGVAIVRGRGFTQDEVASRTPVALVSESVARDIFHGTDPIGRSTSLIPAVDGYQPAAVIIGVVADALSGRLRSEELGTIYWPIDRKRSNPPSILVRTPRPAAVSHAIELALTKTYPTVRPTTRAVADMVGTYLDAKRMMAGLSIGAAGLALALAVLGVYGVTAFVIRQRSEEIGIRIAIGASRGDIFRLLVGQGLRPVLIGLTIGLAGALAGIHWLANILTLAGIGPRDPVAVGTAVTVLLTSAVAAVLAPARRAARTDPANILRAQ